MKSATGVALAILALSGAPVHPAANLHAQVPAHARRVRAGAGANGQAPSSAQPARTAARASGQAPSSAQPLRTAAGASGQADWSLRLGPEEQVDPGRLLNAPNGHISFSSSRGALSVWVPGRLASGQKGVRNKQGSFLLRPSSWSTPDLERAAPTLVFSAPHDSTLACTAPNGFYRDYAAINSVIPGPQPGQLLAFVDGEYHPLGHTKGGVPLLASIGLATSSDGVHWTMKGQIIQGLDAASRGCQAVAKTMTKPSDNEGAAGPSAVVRDEGGQKYIYLYYADRIRLTQPSPTTYLYVARAPYSGGGAPGTWQKWIGSGWGPAANPQHAAPVVTTPPGGSESAHPEISYNSMLRRWLIVFHTREDLYATASRDGTSWDTPQSLSTGTAGARKPAFPTLVSEGQLDQQTTGASGWLFYSRNEGTSYIGYRRNFTIAPAVVRAAPPRTPRQACVATGGTWTGGRCL